MSKPLNLLSLSLLLSASLIFVLAGKLTAVFFIFLFLAALTVRFIFFKLKQGISRKFRSEFEPKKEKINLLRENIRKQSELLKMLPLKAKKADFLFNISRRLIELVDREEILDFLLNAAKDIFKQADGILLFFLSKHSLNLARSFSSAALPVKEKGGDTLDKWVLRHNFSFIIKDLTDDFRFNCREVTAFNQRGARSFIATPFSVGNKIMGVIRAESRAAHAFSLNDLRILRSISDLGVVVLERANLFKKTYDLAIKDSLTLLLSRDYFFTRLKEEIRRASRKGGKLGLIMLDIDNFKKINDTHGHIVGDLVLKRLAKALISVVGDAGNTICRFGGEEFLLFLVESGEKQLKSTGEAIRREAEKATVTFRRKMINFTVSLGGALYPDDGSDLLELIDRVDRLLYQAKKKGKNRLCLP